MHFNWYSVNEIFILRLRMQRVILKHVVRPFGKDVKLRV